MIITLRTKIVLASLGTIFLAIALVAFLLRAQHESTMNMRRVLQENIQSITIAENIKHTFILYDDLIFRAIATGDEVLLEESDRVKRQAQASLGQMSQFARSQREAELLRNIKREIDDYYRDIQQILQTYKTLEEKKSVINLIVRSDDRRDQVQVKKLKEAYEGTMLSAKGRARLQRIYGECEKLLEISRASLEESQRRTEALLAASQRSGSWAAGALVLGTAVISLMLSMSIASPIQRLLSGVVKVTEGELKTDLPVTSSDEVGQLTKAFNHMTEQLNAEHEKLVQETITDQLTGLYNFRHFQKVLTDELLRSSRYRHPFALLIIDIDYFKHYNDTHGHPKGNEVLVMMALLLRSTLRREDFLARYGGEEFVAVLPETDADGARVTAERLQAAVESTPFPNERTQPSGKLTISVGGAVYPKDALTAEALLEKADQALYRAKQEGRNRIFLAAA